MKNTEFRAWLVQLWAENCVERDGFGELPYSQSEYFQRYRWWLRREFRYRNRTQ